MDTERINYRDFYDLQSKLEDLPSRFFEDIFGRKRWEEQSNIFEENHSNVIIWFYFLEDEDKERVADYILNGNEYRTEEEYTSEESESEEESEA